MLVNIQDKNSKKANKLKQISEEKRNRKDQTLLRGKGRCRLSKALFQLSVWESVCLCVCLLACDVKGFFSVESESHLRRHPFPDLLTCDGLLPFLPFLRVSSTPHQSLHVDSEPSSPHALLRTPVPNHSTSPCLPFLRPGSQVTRNKMIHFSLVSRQLPFRCATSSAQPRLHFLTFLSSAFSHLQSGGGDGPNPRGLLGGLKATGAPSTC